MLIIMMFLWSLVCVLFLLFVASMLTIVLCAMIIELFTSIKLMIQSFIVKAKLRRKDENNYWQILRFMIVYLTVKSVNK